jgi:hypothetical protein
VLDARSERSNEVESGRTWQLQWGQDHLGLRPHRRLHGGGHVARVADLPAALSEVRRQHASKLVVVMDEQHRHRTRRSSDHHC